jgi:hypothetical protein
VADGSLIVVVREGGGMGHMMATIDAEDSPLTRIAAPTMLRAVRCPEERPQGPATLPCVTREERRHASADHVPRHRESWLQVGLSNEGDCLGAAAWLRVVESTFALGSASEKITCPSEVPMLSMAVSSSARSAPEVLWLEERSRADGGCP